MHENTLAALIIIVGVALYFLPTFIAFGGAKPHPQAVAILVLNVLGGWTVIGWIAAMVWSVARSNVAHEEKPAAIVGGEYWSKLQSCNRGKEAS